MSPAVASDDDPNTAAIGTQPPPPVLESTATGSVSQTKDEADEGTPEINMVDVPTRKKKKRRGKSAAQRGPTALPKNRGTGFEEYFADPPMTPQEAMTEKSEIYSEDIPFEGRMQACIQRFRSRRRLQGDLTLYFNEYLFLGGVDTSPGAYGGWDSKDLKDLTPAQRREVMASDVIHGGSAAGDRFYDGDANNWSVDFAGVASGFFGNTLVQLTGLEPDRMNPAIEVVENFLRYILQHDACPEYENDIRRALEVCNKAREEWPMICQLQSDLPGEFNLAAAELFVKTSSNDWSFLDYKRPNNFNAKAVFYSAIAMVDDAELFAELCKAEIKLLREYDCTLEITQIDRPTEDIVQRFKTMVLNAGDEFRLKPIGKVTLKPAVIEDEWDHPDIALPLKDEEQITLFFEDHILAEMKPGMKMTLQLGELGGGLRFVKTIRTIVPTFYTFLPQEMMKYFKPPRENERPAPSIHDPDAGENGSYEE
ncbi:Argonaute-binding 1-like protein [Cladobotryum mycophilum]|uniref:Argonaute-binding 1-like protein n=1 Tax=Cladobotryum mycophilum TaxID=491253 RepID=A0ABR0SGY3_9HYPO